MGAYIIRRLLAALLTAWGISMGLFGLVHLAPGSPVDFMVNPFEFTGNQQAAEAAAKAALGLDKPIPVQYFDWLKQVFQGDLGYSYSQHRTVSALIMDRLPATLYLLSVALVVSWFVGTAIGIISALRRNTWVDYGAAVVTLTAHSIPTFFVALLGIYVFGVELGWLPTAGMNSPGGGIAGSLDHLILPALVLVVGTVPGQARFSRSVLLEVLNQDYLVTARSKGVPERVVVLRHAFRNCLIPLVSTAALSVPSVIAGSVVIEMIFAWPGTGQMALNAISDRDYPVIMGFVMMVGFAVLICNLLADLAYVVVDPRIRLARGRA